MKRALGDKVKVTMSLDKATWGKAGEILSEIGISRSGFINVTLTSLVKSAESSMGDVHQSTLGSLFDLATSKRKKLKKLE